MENKTDKVLVTGGNGFIGRHTVNRLLSIGKQVAVVSRSKGDCEGVCYYVGDILNEKFISKAIIDFNPDVIIHLAGSKKRSVDFEDFKECLDVNLMGSLNILKGAVEISSSIKKIIFLGSTEEYGGELKPPFSEEMRESPISSYSLSKTCTRYLAETFSKVYNLPVVYVRPSITYGPGQSEDMFISSIMTSLLSGEPFLMSSGEQRRDFVYIDDLVDFILSVVDSEKKLSGVFNVGGGSSVKIKSLAIKIAKLVQREDLLKLGAIGTRALESEEHLLDNSKSLKELGWKASTSLDDGLKKTLNSFKDKLTSEG